MNGGFNKVKNYKNNQRIYLLDKNLDIEFSISTVLVVLMKFNKNYIKTVKWLFEMLITLSKSTIVINDN